PAIVADRTAAAGAHGVDMSPGGRPTIGATTPSDVAPSKPATAPCATYSGPRVVKTIIPKATENGRTTNVAAKPPQKSCINEEAASLILITGATIASP